MNRSNRAKRLGVRGLLRRFRVHRLALELFALSLIPPALAQTPPLQKKIDEIEKQIELLKEAVKDLRQTPAASADRPSQIDIRSASEASTNSPSAASRRSNTNAPIARILVEGLNRSQVLSTLSDLTDVIGPRLTGSPNLKRANESTRDKLTQWGLT